MQKIAIFHISHRLSYAMNFFCSHLWNGLNVCTICFTHLAEWKFVSGQFVFCNSRIVMLVFRIYGSIDEGMTDVTYVGECYISGRLHICTSLASRYAQTVCCMLVGTYQEGPDDVYHITVVDLGQVRRWERGTHQPRSGGESRRAVTWSGPSFPNPRTVSTVVESLLIILCLYCIYKCIRRPHNITGLDMILYNLPRSMCWYSTWYLKPLRCYIGGLQSSVLYINHRLKS